MGSSYSKAFRNNNNSIDIIAYNNFQTVVPNGGSATHTYTAPSGKTVLGLDRIEQTYTNASSISKVTHDSNHVYFTIRNFNSGSGSMNTQFSARILVTNSSK